MPQFVDDKSREASIIIGINAIREICKRQPLGMHPDLLADLLGYQRHRNKAIGNAARSLLKVTRRVKVSMKNMMME